MRPNPRVQPTRWNRGDFKTWIRLHCRADLSTSSQLTVGRLTRRPLGLAKPKSLVMTSSLKWWSPMTTRQIVIEVPETILLAEKADEQTFAREVRMLAAVKLYELGRLSSGRAAELAGVPRVEFLLALGRYKVFPFEAELNDLEQTYARGHQ
jgi:predicted HTH domain antitoxin